MLSRFRSSLLPRVLEFQNPVKAFNPAKNKPFFLQTGVNHSYPVGPYVGCGRLCGSESFLEYFQRTSRKGELENDSLNVNFDEKAVKEMLGIAVRLQNSGSGVDNVVPDQVLRAFVKYYGEILKPVDRHKFFQLLSKEFGVQGSVVDQSVDAWRMARGKPQCVGQTETLLRAADQLIRSAQPLYSKLFLQLSRIPNGLKFIVGFRGDLIGEIKLHPKNASHLRALSEHLRRRLAEWFNIGVLDLQRLTWESTPAALLEKVMHSDAVHPISNWTDLKLRFGNDRRVFAFFHPSMPKEPLVVLHVALRSKIPTSMSDIHNVPDRVEDPTVGVFYSISATQQGLSGVELGNFLIKQVSQDILMEFKCIRHLVTLSPVPDFKSWLTTCLQRALHLNAHKNQWTNQDQCGDMVLQRKVLLKAVSHTSWLGASPQIESVLHPLFVRLVARYLVLERRRNLALNSVAHFHLKNGAWLSQINWQADMSETGIARSLGIMVNYTYRLNDVESNNRAYLVEHRFAVDDNIVEILTSTDQAFLSRFLGLH